MSTVNYIENKEKQVAILEINRPNHLNALNSEVIKDLNKNLVVLKKSQNIRSVIITGTGEKSFVAGADIKEFQAFNSLQARELSKNGKNQLFDLIIK